MPPTTNEIPVMLHEANYHPNAHCVLNEKVVYEEDVIGGSRHHHMHHHHPETRERVKVVEYEQVPERRVVYEEKYFENSCNNVAWPRQVRRL
ncbi:hypothetical protein AAZX31_04G171000 [Glycine max]